MFTGWTPSARSFLLYSMDIETRRYCCLENDCWKKQRTEYLPTSPDSTRSHNVFVASRGVGLLFSMNSGCRVKHLVTITVIVHDDHRSLPPTSQTLLSALASALTSLRVDARA
eukprot:828539-Rhodomonas_salina.1